MSESPVVYGSLKLLRISLALLILVWGPLTFEAAQYSLPVLHADPLRWVWSCLGTLAGLLVSLSAASYLIKNRIVLAPVVWNLRERDTSYREYATMMNEYAKRYSHLLQRVDWFLLTVMLALATFTVALPFVPVPMSIYSVLLIPYLLVLLVVIDGLVMMRFVYQAAPTRASEYFAWSAPNRLRQAMALLKKCPGISWTGVIMTLGEAAGYYTIQKPSPAGRVAGIENLAVVRISTDRRGRPLSVKSVLRIGDDPDTAFERDLVGDQDAVLASVVADTIVEYVRRVGDPSLVEDTLDELGVLDRVRREEEQWDATHADDLISSDDESAGKREA